MNNDEIVSKPTNNSELESILNNSFLNELGDLMSNDKFSNFFDKHLNNIDDTNVTLIYMKLYKEIQEKYKDIHDKKIDKLSCLHLIKFIMDSPHFRPQIVQSIASDYNNDGHLVKILSDSSINNLLT